MIYKQSEETTVRTEASWSCKHAVLVVFVMATRTMWSSMVFVFCLLTAILTLGAAQMNLYIAKSDVNSYLSKYKAGGNALKVIQNT